MGRTKLEGSAEGGGGVGEFGPVERTVKSLTMGFFVLSFAEGLEAGALALSAFLCSFLKPWSAGAGACDVAAEY